jgi:transcription elongation factor GreA
MPLMAAMGHARPMATTRTTQAQDFNAEANAPARRADGYLITPEGLAALRNRATQLRLAKDREIADRLHDARAFGEPSVNDEYMAIREDEGVLEGRIHALEKLISRATVIDPEPARKGVVTIGSVVAVENLESRRVEHLRIAAGPDATRTGTVSAASPVGQALVGQRVGAQVEIPLPGGRSRSLVIREVAEGALTPESLAAATQENG